MVLFLTRGRYSLLDSQVGKAGADNRANSEKAEEVDSRCGIGEVAQIE